MALKNTRSVTIRPDIHEMAKSTADEYGVSMQEVFESAMDKLHKKLFFEGLRDDFDDLKKKKQAWKKESDRRTRLGINLPEGSKS